MPGVHDKKGKAKLKGSQDVVVQVSIPGYNPVVVREVNLLDLSNANIGKVMKEMAAELRAQFA